MNQEKIYAALPHFFQEMLITLYDYLQYSKRHGEYYHKMKAWFKEREYLPYDELLNLQIKQLNEFLKYASNHSEYYEQKLRKAGVKTIKSIEDLSKIPSISKEELRKNLDQIITIDPKTAYISKTGGTTGVSMQVFFTWNDFQERFALLDLFRERFGYKFKMKTAWFSGKNLLTESDLRKNRFWKQDWLYKIRYYSTFHINQHTALHYLNDIKKYKPEVIVGFPSSIYELAKYGLENNIKLGFKLKAIYPTAETLVEHEVKILSKYFGCGVHDQYASSEGANFITECENGNLHYEMLSGVIEVLDKNNKAVKTGRMVLTSFTTHGTPLIRYEINDVLSWSEKKNCLCGRNTPIVDKIEGRINDFVYSVERGKINLGNISNCVKNVKGVSRFQVIQNKIDQIDVIVVKDLSYTEEDEKLFLSELRHRLGNLIKIDFSYVNKIEREASGKYRIVKNNLKNIS